MAKPANKKFTFKKYWAKNKDKINETRREKYQTDPEYRASIRETAKETYAANKRTVPIDRRTITDNTGKRYWSIGRIARLINRKVLTIRQYHKQGVLPDPKYYDSRGWRLYTQQQAAILRIAFRRLDDPEDTTVQSLADITALVSTRWEEE